MPAPALFIGAPVVVAAVLYLLRGTRVLATGLAVVTTLLLGLLALGLPLQGASGALAEISLEPVLVVLGRTFEIEAGDRLALAFIFGQAALLFLVSGLGRPSPLFLPAGMANLGLVAAALFVSPFLFAALFLQLGAALAVFMLAGPERGAGGENLATRGALRFLVYTTLGLPFILLTGWLLEASSASPADFSLTAQATVLLMVAFAIWLAVVPFHSWVPVIAEHAPPFAAAYVFSVMRLAVTFLLLTFLNTYPWLSDNTVVYRALVVAGGGMALVGAIFAFGQRNFGRLMGYLMLVDFGAVMLGIGLASRAGVEAAFVTLALRAVALPLWATGLDRLRRAGGGDSFDDLRGMARLHPLAAVAVVVGTLSVAGFPLTAGFTGRWGLLRLLAQIHPTAAVLLLLGTVAAGFVVARGLVAMLAPVPAASGAERPLELPARASLALYSVGFTVVLILGLFPQWLLPAVAGTAAAFTRLLP